MSGMSIITMKNGKTRMSINFSTFDENQKTLRVKDQLKKRVKARENPKSVREQQQLNYLYLSFSTIRHSIYLRLFP
jgi:hypothetical protein